MVLAKWTLNPEPGTLLVAMAPCSCFKEDHAYMQRALKSAEGLLTSISIYIYIYKHTYAYMYIYIYQRIASVRSAQHLYEAVRKTIGPV